MKINLDVRPEKMPLEVGGVVVYKDEQCIPYKTLIIKENGLEQNMKSYRLLDLATMTIVTHNKYHIHELFGELSGRKIVKYFPPNELELRNINV